MAIMPSGRRVLLGAALALLLPGTAFAQKTLTLDEIYDPVTRVNFSGNPATGLTWIDGSRYLWPRETAGNIEWTIGHAADGTSHPLFDAGRMQAALTRLPGVSDTDARRVVRSRSLVFDEALSAALLTLDGDLYVYRFAEDRAIRLTSTPAIEDVPSFSPDGSRVAFVRGNDLHVVEVGSGREVRLTTDGTEKILNGKLDWVYEEEIFGRGHKQGYWWSPDSSRIAFLRLDDGPVPTFVVVDDIPEQQVVERLDYPRPGDPNPLVTLGVVPSAGGAVRWIDLEAYPAEDRLLVGVSWVKRGGRLVYEVQNRIQTWLDVNLTDPDTRESRRLLRETSKAWVNPPEDAHPTWLPDGSFLWLSERSG
jgi:dipeptidyl-peptidase-4